MPARRRVRAEQPLLGLVAPKGFDERARLSPSQREMLRRAGTILSPGQQIAARRRAIRAENREAAELEEAIDEVTPPDVLATMRGLFRPMPSATPSLRDEELTR